MSSPATAPSPIRASSLRRDACARVTEHFTNGPEAERLSAMGLGVGAIFRVLKAGSCLTVRVGGTRVALGREWADSLGVVEL